MVTSFDEARSWPAGGSGMKWPTSRGANGSAMSNRRRPCANQANGMTEPRNRSDGWWQPLIAGCCIVGVTSLGILGSLIPETGFGFPDLDLPGDATAEVRWVIVRWPSAGTLEVLEDSSWYFHDAPDGRYFFDAECFKSGRSYGVKRVILLIGETLKLSFAGYALEAAVPVALGLKFAEDRKSVV